MGRKNQFPAGARQAARPAPPQNNQPNTIQVAAHHVEFQGPLPPPDILEKYEGIQAGFADRIVQMAEAEQRHRHALENTVVQESFNEARRGQKYGLIIGIVAILAGAVVAGLGAAIPGAIIGGGGVIGLVSVFVLGRFFPTSKPGQPSPNE